MSETLWVDVSEHDWARRGGPLDWVKIRAATSPVMCARATYGDPGGFYRPTYHFGDLQAGAAFAGFILRGGYHNLVRGDAASMKRQVDWLRRELDAYGCRWAMADVERYPELLAADMWPRYDDVRRFQDAWYAAETRVMAWYVPRWVWSYWGNADLTVLRGPLVQSHYADGIHGSPASIYAQAGGNAGVGWSDRYGGRYPDFWQYTSLASVDGASAQTDVNAFRGSIDQLATVLIGETTMALDLTEDQNFVALIWRVLKGVIELQENVDTHVPALGTEKNMLRAKLDAILTAASAPATVAMTADDRAAIIAGVVAELRPAIDGLRAAVRSDTRDAVADLGEGGAAAVRGQV